MFLLDFLPVWSIYVIAVSGLALFLYARFFPSFAVFPYTLVNLGLEVVGIAVIASCCYLMGGVENQTRWETKVKEAETVVAKKEEASKEANVKIVEKIVIQKQIIKEKRNETTKAVVKNTDAINATCELSNSFVVLHDSASQAIIPPSTIPDAETASDVKASEALDVITQNYLTYYELRDLVMQWQEWYRTQKEIQEQ